MQASLRYGEGSSLAIRLRLHNFHCVPSPPSTLFRPTSHLKPRISPTSRKCAVLHSSSPCIIKRLRLEEKILHTVWCCLPVTLRFYTGLEATEGPPWQYHRTMRSKNGSLLRLDCELRWVAQLQSLPPVPNLCLPRHWTGQCGAPRSFHRLFKTWRWGWHTVSLLLPQQILEKPVLGYEGAGERGSFARVLPDLHFKARPASQGDRGNRRIETWAEV